MNVVRSSLKLSTCIKFSHRNKPTITEVCLQTNEIIHYM